MILLMGSAGAGKGTQGKLLVEKNDYSYISTGELLRRQASKEQQQRMVAGELLDDQEITGLLKTAMEVVPDPQHCILDGFPRTLSQADWLLEYAKKDRFKVTAVINLAISEEATLERLLKRGRPDDTSEVIAKRFDEHQSLTVPILSHFKEAGIPVFDIDASQSPEVVHQVVEDCLNSLEK